jgi:hypothetical protein
VICPVLLPSVDWFLSRRSYLIVLQYNHIPFVGCLMQPLGVSSFQKGFDLVRAVDRYAIPDEQDRARDLAQEHPEETHHGDSIIACLANLKEQSPIQRDTADSREMVARLPHGRILLWG